MSSIDGGSRWIARALTAAVITIAALLAAGPIHAFIAEEDNTIAVYERVAPSVVNVTTAARERGPFLSVVPDESAGSGIILSDDGAIMTNYHVVAGAESIVVTVEEDLHFKAVVEATAPSRDMALLRIDPGTHRLRPIVLVDSSQIRVGEKVLAIGNPFGLGRTLTTGTVSMVDRDIRRQDQVLRGLIQIDASINPGNSGGGLFNSRGELIGMSTLILSPTGANIGIGFAIPSNRIATLASAMASPWQRYLGWGLAVLVVFWLLRRLYGRGADSHPIH